MDEFAQMHIFFVVTTGAVVVVAAAIAVAMYYVIRILRILTDISEAALEEGELIREDIAELRSSVRREGAKVKAFVRLGKKFTQRFSEDDTK